MAPTKKRYSHIGMVWYGRQDPGVRFGGFYSLLEKASCASPVLAAIA